MIEIRVHSVKGKMMYFCILVKVFGIFLAMNFSCNLER